MSDSDDRQMGVELGELNDELETHEYPASVDELLDAYGDYELELPNGSETLRGVLEPLEGETYESGEEVRQMIYNMVGDQAVGREDYSDRGPTADQREGESDEESL